MGSFDEPTAGDPRLVSQGRLVAPEAALSLPKGLDFQSWDWNAQCGSVAEVRWLGFSNLNLPMLQAIYTDSVMGTWRFTPDTLNRLATAHNTATTSTSTQYASDWGCWSYDAFGNRLSQSMSTTACGSNPPLTSWALNRQA